MYQQERENVLRLLNSGDIASANLALQILSSGAVDWSKDIEQAISMATFTMFIRRDSIREPFYVLPCKLFGLSIFMVDQKPTLQYSFCDRHTWQCCWHEFAKPIELAIQLNIVSFEQCMPIRFD